MPAPVSRLAVAADRLAANPKYDHLVLAGRLLQWQLTTGIGDADIARRLGVTADGLLKLRLCRPPVSPDDVRRIAEYVGASVDAVRSLLREVGRR